MKFINFSSKPAEPPAPAGAAGERVVSFGSADSLEAFKAAAQAIEPEAPAAEAPAMRPVSAAASDASMEFALRFKAQILPYLIQHIDPKLLLPGNETALRARAEALVDDRLRVEQVPLGRVQRSRILKEIVDEMVGYGPLEPLLADDSISEVMVNGPKTVYVERKGRIELTGVTFMDDPHVRRVIDKIIAPLGRRIDEASPMVDARLPDGSRVNAIIPPLALTGSTITIRKFRADPLKMQDLLRYKSFSPEVALFLTSAVRSKMNIIVSGGTGTGKTTMLNVLSACIPNDERIVTIEDAAELQLQQEHVVRLEARPRNIEGKGEITIRDLVRNSLRMRPDRIVVGECRGGEALDMLQAMSTGHDGSLTTLHANTARDCLARLETLVMMAGMELPQRAIREQIASAINYVVQIARLNDGTRRLVSVSELQGMEGATITMQDLFRFEQSHVDAEGRVHGALRGTGIISKYSDRFRSMGHPVPTAVFQSSMEV
jgi:pilus assembly protein CpaF